MHRTVQFAVVMLLATASQALAQVPTASTVQLPTFGVSIDADGMLRVKTFEDPTGAVQAARVKAAKQLPPDLAAASKLRKVSLPRLEREIRRRLDDGQQPDDAMRHLAGLTRLQFVFVYPDDGDLVIAGPAEGWTLDASGRSVGIDSGRAVLELADLLAALRAYPPGQRRDVFIGCTVDPTPEGLTRVNEFQKTIPHVIPESAREQVAGEIARGLHDSLGPGAIRVFGVPADTHFAQVLLEADCRMKLIGIGLERPPVKLASFLDLSGSATRGTLQRWWFTPDYECLRVTADGLGVELVGQGVQLQSENKVITTGGTLTNAATSNKASDLFTAGFTQRYPELAARSPVFAQLRNLIDTVITAAFMQEHNLAGRAKWSPGCFLDEQALSVRDQPTPKHADPAINAVWKGNRLVTAAGGVSIQAEQALDPRHRVKDDGRLAPARDAVKLPADAARWWWD